MINGKGGNVFMSVPIIYYIKCIAKIDAEKSGMKKKNAFF